MSSITSTTTVVSNRHKMLYFCSDENKTRKQLKTVITYFFTQHWNTKAEFMYIWLVPYSWSRPLHYCVVCHGLPRNDDHIIRIYDPPMTWTKIEPLFDIIVITITKFDRTWIDPNLYLLHFCIVLQMLYYNLYLLLICIFITLWKSFSNIQIK